MDLEGLICHVSSLCEYLDLLLRSNYCFCHLFFLAEHCQGQGFWFLLIFSLNQFLGSFFFLYLCVLIICSIFLSLLFSWFSVFFPFSPLIILFQNHIKFVLINAHFRTLLTHWLCCMFWHIRNSCRALGTLPHLFPGRLYPLSPRPPAHNIWGFLSFHILTSIWCCQPCYSVACISLCSCLFILAVLGLRCCAGCSLVAVYGLLLIAGGLLLQSTGFSGCSV